MQDLYNRIHYEMNKLGITSNELGQKLGLKKGPVTDWKNGKSKPTLEQLIKMCEIFAVSADYLLFGKCTTLSSKETIELINKYNALSPNDKKEIQMLIEYKLQNIAGDKSKSSHLKNDLNDIAAI